jgi:heme/copper-type cytochrome/quinol oxidase subunit 2
VKTITVKRGQRVHFTVSSSDTEDEVHLHGYDLSKELAPGRPVSFSFRATIEGVFEGELEGRKEQIVSLAVEPS